jgi:adenylate cyclase
MTYLLLLTIVVAIYAVFITAMWWRQRQEPQVNSIQDNANTVTTALAQSQDTGSEVSEAMLAKADEAQRLQQTFQKFVPRQFVEHFAKGGAELLSLGYADEDEVAVMFCDIRGFTRLSEQMSPQQLMNFLNSYFLRMNAPIHDNGGFIDKFIGDAIMALFDHPAGTSADKANDAINAALDLQKALHLYNHHRANSGYPPIKHGIGLHYGPVVLGTVGSDDRMDTTVIGDTVNVAQRIESLTEHFGLEILCTKSLIEAAQATDTLACRSIDEVVLKGKSTSIEILEIFQHLDANAIKQRQKSISVISEGVRLRNQKDFKAALDIFKQGRETHPQDKVFDYHINLCQKLMYQLDWDGVVRL